MRRDHPCGHLERRAYPDEQGAIFGISQAISGERSGSSVLIIRNGASENRWCEGRVLSSSPQSSSRTTSGQASAASSAPAPSSSAAAPNEDQRLPLPTLHQFFSPGGVLSARFPQYEFRRGQLEMA